MYKILFVDEDEAEIRRFQRYVRDQDTDKRFDVITKLPLENLGELVDNIFSENIDAIISDYQLAEYMPAITYTGVELIEKIQNKKANFPCFVMTSHDDKAVATSLDVNIVYIKGLMGKESNIKSKGLMGKEGNIKITFLERIKSQIDHYQAKIKNSQDELNQIIAHSKKKELTAEQEERLLYLDDFIEKSTDKESKIPKQLKRKSTLNDLHKLIENTDKLLKNMDNTNGK